VLLSCTGALAVMHVAFQVGDLSPTLSFYFDLLGLQELGASSSRTKA
jgi:extradiol dioxygenase family protein